MPTYLVTYHHGPGLPSDPAVLQQMLAAFRGHPYFSGGGALQVNESVRVGP